MKLALRNEAAERVRRGFPWIFAEDVPQGMASVPPGEAVTVTDLKGANLAHGFANPRSKLAVRLASWLPKEDISHPVFLPGRLRAALARRAAACPGVTTMRLVHSEADGLPGLTIDRVGDVLVVQRAAPWLETQREALVEVLREIPGVTAIFADEEGEWRAREALPEARELWFGELPERISFTLDGGATCFATPLLGDRFIPDAASRELRATLAARCVGREVLDLYAGPGAFGMQALHAGAERVVIVDKAEENAESAVQGSEAAGLADRCDVFAAPVEAALAELLRQGRRFDVILMDPPPFAKRAADLKDALKGHQQLVRSALPLLAPDGLLAATTRSFPIDSERFERAVLAGVGELHRTARRLHRIEQGSDLPSIPGFVQGEHLKGALWQVSLS